MAEGDDTQDGVGPLPVDPLPIGPLPSVPDWISDIGDDGSDRLKKLAGISGGGAAVLVAFGEDPVGFLVGLFNQQVVVPALEAFGTAFGSLYGSLLWIAFGDDQTFGEYPRPMKPSAEVNSAPGGDVGLGIVDLPMYIGSVVIDLVDVTLATPILEVVTSLNEEIAAVSTQLGIASPFVLPVLWMLELAALVAIGLFVLKSVDVPGINQGPSLDALTAPGRRLLGWLRN